MSDHWQCKVETSGNHETEGLRTPELSHFLETSQIHYVHRNSTRTFISVTATNFGGRIRWSNSSQCASLSTAGRPGARVFSSFANWHHGLPSHHVTTMNPCARDRLFANWRLGTARSFAADLRCDGVYHVDRSSSVTAGGWPIIGHTSDSESHSVFIIRRHVWETLRLVPRRRYHSPF